MTTAQFLLAGWQWKPEVLGGCAIAGAGYAALARPGAGRALLFAGGLAVLLLALVSPLDTLAHTYLFSAHMAQHLLLLLVVPPLLLLGLPAGIVARVLARPAAGRAARLATNPLVAWLAFNGIMWVWHLPVLYEATLRDDAIHIGEHLLFLIAATAFWWPVVAPDPAGPGLPAWGAFLYLFTALVASSVLGIVITFAPPGLYPAYAAPRDAIGLLPLVREGWGLSFADDQQLGGLLMWIPGGFVYSVAMFGALARWFAEPEEDEEEWAETESKVEGLKVERRSRQRA